MSDQVIRDLEKELDRSGRLSSLQRLAHALINTPGDTCSGQCDADLYKNGRCIVVLSGPRASVFEAWAAYLRTQGVVIDWHFAGGHARFLIPKGDQGKMIFEIRRALPALAWAYAVETDGEYGLLEHWPTKMEEKHEVST